MGSVSWAGCSSWAQAKRNSEGIVVHGRVKIIKLNFDVGARRVPLWSAGQLYVYHCSRSWT